MERNSAYEEYMKKRKKKMKRKRINAVKRRIFFSIVFILLGSAIYFLYNSTVFEIDEIVCSGNAVVSTEDIINTSGINIGDNLFLSSIKRARENISQIPYIDSYKIWRALPNKINIEITESIPIAYIGEENTFWMVDKNGKLLEMSESYNPEKQIPLITGITVENYKVGDVLHSSRNELLSQGIKCAEILKHYDLINKTNEINIENINDIKISYDNRLFMYMGSMDTLEYKLGIVKKILDDRQITEYEHAVLNYRTDKLYVGNEDMFTATPNPTESENPTTSENPLQSDDPNESEKVQNIDTTTNDKTTE